MNFNGDVVLHKGHKHKVCEDFVLLEKFDNFDVVVLCDGCSSAPHTSLGAQILSHSIVSQIRLQKTSILSPDMKNSPMVVFSRIIEQAVQQASEVIDLLYVDAKSLLCTCIVVIRTDEAFYMYRCGDGVFIIETTSSLIVHSYHYKDNEGQETPFYPVYIMSDVIPDHFRDNVYFSVNTQRFDKHTNGSLFCVEQNSSSHENTFDMIHSCVVISPTEDIVGVYAASDGILSFMNSRTNSPAVFSDVLSLLFDIKDSAGSFLERTVMSRFGAISALSKVKIYNYDDLSIGGFRKREEV